MSRSFRLPKCSLFLEPILFYSSLSRLTRRCLTLNLNLLGFISLQLLSEGGLGLLRTPRGGWDGPFLDLAFAIRSLGSGGFIGFQFTEVEFLNQIRC